MSVEVKVCGITRPEDARKAVELGADYIGVIRYEKSPRYVPDAALGELLAAIPGGKRVMVDVSPATTALEHNGDFGFDFFQIHCDLDVSLGTLAAWSGIVSPQQLWLAPRIPTDESFPQIILEFADSFLIDAYSENAYGGTGHTGDWQRFAEWSTLYTHKRWILAGGLNPDNVQAAVEATGAEVIDVNSGVESSPGIKDTKKMETLFRELENIVHPHE